MARIPMTSGFVVIPEGEYIFRIYDVDYDEEFGKVVISLVTAKGLTHKERFSIKNKDDEVNEGAMNALSFFAKVALNDYDRDDFDPSDLIDCYICAEVVHTKLPSSKDPTKTVTFANLGDKSSADGFDEEPVAKALSLGKDKDESAPKAEKKKGKSNGIDLDALLG
ncbi:hypothetical protein FACS189499_03630 [Clostridia bacterium]|nr:hypothetical protein FACS189499_03630 [Clostridia bacterium]